MAPVLKHHQYGAAIKYPIKEIAQHPIFSTPKNLHYIIFCIIEQQKKYFMETTDYQEESAPVAEVKAPKRPVFILVLCILTFIGSGLGIVGSLFSLATAQVTADVASKTSEQMEDLQDRLGNKSNAFTKLYSDSFSHITAAHIRTQAGLNILASLITLCGGLLMFGLRKIGFYIYIVGHVVSIGAGIAMGPGGALGGMGIGVGIFFSLVFIVLYGVNYKHLVR
jgi:hypothetical protein